MSYFNKNSAQRPSQQGSKTMQKPLPNNNKQFQQQNGMMMKDQAPTEELLGFTQDEVVFIENVLVKLEELIDNEQGQNEEILEMIITSQQIISARLDKEAGFIGDSA